MNLSPQWQTERSRFNHDWLKNDFINHLNALANLPADKLNQDSVAANIEQWDAQISRIQKLIDTVENDMSPARLFEEAPLSDLAECHKQWVIPCLHDHWSKENDIPGIKAKMADGLEKIKAAFCVFREKFNDKNFSGEDVRAFADICQEYSNYLSTLRNLSVLP